MGLTSKELNELIRRCDPDEVLEPGAERYVDIDGIRTGESPRRHLWARRIANVFAGLRPGQTRILFFTGVPGSGKSTELRRIAENLRDPAGAALFPVLIDASASIDRSSPLSIVTLIFVILYETERAVLELEGREPDSAGQDSVVKRLWDRLDKTEVELKNVGFGPAKLVFELKRNASFRTAMVEQVKQSSLTDFVDQARTQMQTLRQRVTRYDIRGDGQDQTNWSNIILIVDSLEKVGGFGDAFTEVLDSLIGLFTHGRENLDLGVSAIFTVPVALVQSENIEVEFMPLVKIRDREGVAYQPGIDAMRALLDKRVAPSAQSELFGDAHEDRVKTMIETSAGYPRELVAMLEEMLRQAADWGAPLSEKRFDAALGERASRYTRVINQADYATLVHVHETKDHLPPSREQLERFGTLLKNSVIMMYQNADDWADLNPALRRHPELSKQLR